MSRGGSRFGAGRPAWHAKTGTLPSIDLRRLMRCGALQHGYALEWRCTSGPTTTATARVHDGFMRFEYARGRKRATEDVQIARTGCTYGGTRPWFRCPYCWRRCLVLYLGQRLACRQCYRLRYPSQSEDVIGRIWRAKARLAKRIGSDSVNWDEAEKPRGMHWSTFERIQTQLGDLGARLDGALALFAGRLMGLR